MKITVLIGMILITCLTAMAGTTSPSHELLSPDGKISITIYTDSPLGYSIKVDGIPVLLRSALGLDLAGDVKFGE